MQCSKQQSLCQRGRGSVSDTCDETYLEYEELLRQALPTPLS
jgi:hypothetical protein